VNPTVFEQVALIPEGVILDLVSENRRVGELSGVIEALDRKVTHADMSDQSFLPEFGHCAEGLFQGCPEVALVDQEEIDGVGLELVQARLRRSVDARTIAVRPVEFRGQKEVLAIDPGFLDRRPDFAFVPVGLCGIDVSVSEIERCPNRLPAFGSAHPPRPEAECRDFGVLNSDVLHTRYYRSGLL
jgi:hypothetical protein